MYTCIHKIKRIQSSGTPVSNTHHQENKGDQRVQQSGHHVTDRPAEYEITHTHHEVMLRPHGLLTVRYKPI